MSSNKTNIQPASEDTLKKLDYILLIDHSGSTSNPSKRVEGSLFDEMREQALQLATLAEKYDDDGITLIAFSSSVIVKDGVKAATVRDVFKEFSPGGQTNLGLALEEAYKKAKASSKEVVVFVFTDGAASDPSRVKDVLTVAGKELGRPKIGFSFIQVGDDPDAAKFLADLDDSLKVDVVATFTSEQAEKLSIAQLVEAARTE